jgi:hypothetical protein
MLCSEKMIKALKAINSLIYFDDKVIESIDFLNFVWEEIGFQRLNKAHFFLKFVLYELGCMPIINGHLFHSQYLSMLQERSNKFYQMYKKETMTLGKELLSEFTERYPD